MLTFHALVLPVIRCDTTLTLLYNCVSPLVVIEGRHLLSASRRRLRGGGRARGPAFSVR